MNYLELIKEVNNINENDPKKITEIIEKIDINQNNFNDYTDFVFSDHIAEFDIDKLTDFIGELYKTEDIFKFMLCCMLLESVCHKLNYLPPLEKYPLSNEKFNIISHTLVTIYNELDNGIANCMALIILKHDPTLKSFEKELKDILLTSTKRKLTDILKYLSQEDTKINPTVYDDLEIIVDLACYLKDKEVSTLIEQLDIFPLNSMANIYIIKYKLVNNLPIATKKIKNIINKPITMLRLYTIMEDYEVSDIYLKNITQEQLAKAELITWLSYPTELGDMPDHIELLGTITLENYNFYIYQFSKENFKVKGQMLGIAGGYDKNKITSHSTGYTFSEFELVTNNWHSQAQKLIDLVKSYWQNWQNR